LAEHRHGNVLEYAVAAANGLLSAAIGRAVEARVMNNFRVGLKTVTSANTPGPKPDGTYPVASRLVPRSTLAVLAVLSTDLSPAAVES